MADDAAPDRETIIRVVEYLAESGIGLAWWDYEPVEDDTGMEQFLSIDAEDAIEIVADPDRYQRKLEMECAKRMAEERFRLACEPPEMKAWRAFNEEHHSCLGKTPTGRACRLPVVHSRWKDPATFDPGRPEHHFCAKHLAERAKGGESS